MSDKHGQKRELKPRLRFPKFQQAEEWEKKKIYQIADLYKGKGISKADIAFDGEQPCIRYGELYTSYAEVIKVIISRTNLPSSDLFLSKKNDVLIPASGETKIDIATASCVTQDGVALGGDINILRSRQNGIFLSYQLNGTVKNEMAKVAQGDTVVHLYPTQIKVLDVAIPSAQEQKKIADCLCSIDELITAKSLKLAALNTLKRGWKQKLFPAEGESIPRLRFPEFQGTGEWREKKLKDILIPELREVPKPTSTYVGLGLRSHGKGTFQKPDQVPEKNSMDWLYLVYRNDLIVNITFAWEGAIAIANDNDHGCYVSHRFPTYTFKSLVSTPEFFRHIITDPTFVHELGLISPGGAGRNRVMNKKDFLNISVLLPSLQEQKKISDLLSSIDLLINTEARNVDALKAHKKGLMQQLFPVVNETKG